jgi:hypothetical protein
MIVEDHPMNMYSLALIIFVVSEKKAFEHFIVEDLPMIIHVQFGFNHICSF